MTAVSIIIKHNNVSQFFLIQISDYITVLPAGIEACRQGFSPGTPVSSPPSLISGTASKIKLK